MSELLEVVLAAKAKGIHKLDLTLITQEDVSELRSHGYDVSITESLRWARDYRVCVIVDLRDKD